MNATKAKQIKLEIYGDLSPSLRLLQYEPCRGGSRLAAGANRRKYQRAKKAAKKGKPQKGSKLKPRRRSWAELRRANEARAAAARERARSPAGTIYNEAGDVDWEKVSTSMERGVALHDMILNHDAKENDEDGR